MTGHQFDPAEVWQSYEDHAFDLMPPAILWNRLGIVKAFGPVHELPGVDSIVALQNLSDDDELKHTLTRIVEQTLEQESSLESRVGLLKIRSKLIRLPSTEPDQPLVLTLFDRVESTKESANEPGESQHQSTLEQAREKLRLIELRFQTAMEGSSVGILEFDLDNSDWVFADHVERLLGFEPGELENSRGLIRNRIHPDDLRVNDEAKELETRGQDTSIELRLKDKSGEYRWFSVDSRVELDSQGQPKRVIGTIADINELKKAQLKSSEEVRRRDEFVAILSHELRNPMAAITFSLDCLEALGKLPGESQDLLDIISRQTIHMSKLLQDLLDVSRLTRNRIDFEMANHDLNESISDVVNSVLPSITVKNQTLLQNLSSEPLWVHGDVARLKQVMINLLDNASKYTPEDGQISIETRELDGQVFFSISDSGCGLEESSSTNLFELFYQADSSSHSRSGIGVGLFLVEQIMRAHGGSVFAESAGQGQGSTFTISLPFFHENASIEHVSEASAQIGKDIMLVEDNVDSLKSLSRLLKRRGFQVVQFVDGEAASGCLDSIEFSVAIIDVDLPGKNGLQLAREIREIEHFKSSLLVAMTGYSQIADRNKIIAAGFDLHIVKPTSFIQLLKRIAEAFANKSASRADPKTQNAPTTTKPIISDETLFGNHS